MRKTFSICFLFMKLFTCHRLVSWNQKFETKPSEVRWIVTLIMSGVGGTLISLSNKSTSEFSHSMNNIWHHYQTVLDIIKLIHPCSYSKTPKRLKCAFGKKWNSVAIFSDFKNSQIQICFVNDANTSPFKLCCCCWSLHGVLFAVFVTTAMIHFCSEDRTE